MRIGIDARAAVEERGGRGTLVRELLRALAQRNEPHHFVLFARERWDEALPADRFGWKLSALDVPWWNLRVGLRAHRYCDVLVSSNSYLTAWFTRVPSVVIVYDLVAFDDNLHPQRRAKFIERATLPLAARRAAAFTAISRATAGDLAQRFPMTADKTTVTLLGGGDRFAGGGGVPVADVLARHRLERPYVLAVGTLEPRKNLPRLIEAFATLPATLRDKHDLVLVGAAGWDTDATFEAIGAHGDRVRALGHVSDAELGTLYRAASLFAYPSLYEGFGLPVLEAMGAGTPVLTSDRSSLPEVAGDAALYCDPLDVASIRAGLERGLTDPEEAHRLADRGRERAATFSWDAFAAGTLAAAEHAAKRRV